MSISGSRHEGTSGRSRRHPNERTGRTTGYRLSQAPPMVLWAGASMPTGTRALLPLPLPSRKVEAAGEQP